MLRFHRRVRLFAAALLLPFVGACLEATEPVQLVDIPCTFTFAFDTTQMTRTSTGLFFRDLTVGAGQTVGPGNEVYVNYTGWLTTGQSFDSNVPGSPAGPFGFPLGAGYVIAGFDQGVAGMRVGGCRQLVIPPQLAYGSSGYGTIGPNEWLVFEIGLAGAR